GNAFFLRCLPERRKSGLASAIHRLADEEQDTGSRAGTPCQESQGAHAGIDRSRRAAVYRNGSEGALEVPRVERFGDGDLAAIGNYSGFAGFAHEESINRTTRFCDERHILAYVLIHLDGEGNGNRWGTRVQGYGLRATIIEDAKSANCRPGRIRLSLEKTSV